MQELKVFENQEFGSVRAVEIEGEPMFVAKDIAEMLGYSNPRKAILDHVDEEDKGVTKCDTLGGAQELTVINESGVYSLILRSNLPKAKEFKRWVTRDILPTIRRHGMYATDKLLNNPDFAIKVFQKLREEREKVKSLEGTIEENKPKVLFADAVSASHTSILVGELAKILKQNGYNTGQQRLFEELRERDFLMKAGSSRNMPTQRAMEMGLFEIKETTISNPDGSIRVNRTTKVTGKGQQYFINMFVGKVKEA